MRDYRDRLEGSVATPPAEPEREQTEPRVDHQPEAKPSEVELARQREVAMAVVDRAAPLFKALAKR